MKCSWTITDSATHYGVWLLHMYVLACTLSGLSVLISTVSFTYGTWHCSHIAAT